MEDRDQGSGIRFFVIATAKRGRLRPSELLDGDGQAAAFSSWREDESRAVRVGFELGKCVVWNSETAARKKPPLPQKTIERNRIERMMELSRKIA